MVSKSQAEASKKWDNAHREKKRYMIAKSTAKRFVSMANQDDLAWLKKLIEERL